LRISDFALPSDAVGQAANVQGDDRIPDGVQWRMSLGRAFRLPAGPVVLHRCWVEPIKLNGTNAVATTRELPAEVTPRRPLTVFPLRWPGQVPFWVEVVGDGHLRVAVTAPVLAPNRLPIELAAVDEPPFRVGSAALGAVLVTGEGRVDDVRVWYLETNLQLGTERLSIDALPDDYFGAFRTYAWPHSGGHGDWKQRILAAAPSIEVPYAPVSPDPFLSADTELDRVDRLVNAEASVHAWLRHTYESADAGQDDVVVIDEPVPGDRPVRARHHSAESLGVAAIDPGVSRWLARTGTVDGAAIGGGAHGLELLVAQVPGLFLGSPAEASDFGGSPGELYNEALDDGWVELLQSIEDLRDPGARTAVQVRLLNVPIALTVDSRAARPLPPQAASAGDPTWYEDASTYETGWRQTIALRGIAPTGPVALEQVAPGERRTLHPIVDDDVAAPMTAAWSPRSGPSTVTATVPVDAADELADVTWRVHVGDWTGRWSDAVELASSPPARPKPADCALEAWYTPADPMPAGHATTGTVRIAISFAPSGLPGGVPVDRIEWSVDGAPQDTIVLSASEQAAGLRALRDVPAPPTSPGQSTTMQVTAVAVDDDEARSNETSVTLAIADPRPLPAPRISPRLMPTSRPTADPEVSITLTATGLPERGAVRFLFANETAVRAALGIGDADFRETPRYERAERLRQAGGGPKRAYSAATPAPVRAQGGRATAMLRFPAGSNDLILVRAIPVALTTDAAGIEKETASTPFEATQPAFVIVPTSDVPGIPSVRAEAAPNGKVTVDVRVAEVSTRRFGGAPPEARLVQVVDGMPPAYWPEVATLVLDRLAGGEHTGRVTLPGPAWTRVGLAASVRYPAEPLIAPGAVVATSDLIAAGPAASGAAARAPWGPISAPAWVDVPGPAPRVDATVEADGSWRVEVGDLPPARPGRPGFAAELYRGADALVLESTTLVDADHAEFTAGPFVGDSGAVVLVDPFGGRGSVRRLPT
jgi:hypothetical protein